MFGIPVLNPFDDLRNELQQFILVVQQQDIQNFQELINVVEISAFSLFLFIGFISGLLMRQR